MLPQSMLLYLTYKCQLKCSHCFLVKDNLINKFELPYELAIKAIDDAAENNVFLLPISGGDPLLHPRFFDIVNYARSRNLLPLLGSTGIDISIYLAKKIREAEIPCVQLSLDGYTDTQNRYYRGNNSFSKILDSAKNLMSESVNVNLSVCIDRNNVRSFEDFLSFAYEQNFYKLKVAFLTNKTVANIKKHQEISQSEIQKIVALAKEFEDKNSIKNWIMFANGSKSENQNSSIIIGADGSIKCKEDGPVLGNLRNKKPSEVYLINN